MPTPKGKKKSTRGVVDLGVDVGVGSSTMGVSMGGGSSSKASRKKKSLDKVSLEEQVAKRREMLIEERQKELDAIVDKHDDLVRISLDIFSTR